VSSAMAAYVPLARKVFGALAISRKVRLHLFNSLVMSRLIYNVHTWSTITRQMYVQLNAVYMRGLRRIADQCRYSAKSSTLTDHQVRLMLGAQSFQCLISQRRLQLLATILKHAPEQLRNLLAVRTHGVPLPWVQQVVADITQLRDYHAPKLDDLGDFVLNSASWSGFIVNYPSVWSIMVKQMCITSMGLDAKPTRVRESGSLDAFSCAICGPAGVSGCSFATFKALQTHMRAKHKQRNALTQYLDTSLTCPVCYISFDNFAKLLGHVTDARRRGVRPLCCNQVLKAGLVHPVSRIAQEAAQKQAREERKRGRRLGHTTPLVRVPAKRPKPGTIVPEMYRNVRPRTLNSSANLPCINSFDWDLVRPVKRLRTKTCLDLVVARTCAARGII